MVGVLSSPALVLVSVEQLDLVEAAEEESPPLILGGGGLTPGLTPGQSTEAAGGLKTLTAQGDLQVRLGSGQVRSGQVPGGPGSHLGSKARLLPGVLGALTVVAAPSTPVLFPLSLPLPLALPLLTDTGDSSVPTEFTVRRNILGEWMRALVRKPEKEGEELSSWLWLSLPCRRVGLRGKK